MYNGKRLFIHYLADSFDYLYLSIIGAQPDTTRSETQTQTQMNFEFRLLN